MKERALLPQEPRCSRRVLATRVGIREGKPNERLDRLVEHPIAA